LKKVILKIWLGRGILKPKSFAERLAKQLLCYKASQQDVNRFTDSYKYQTRRKLCFEIKFFWCEFPLVSEWM